MPAHRVGRPVSGWCQVCHCRKYADEPGSYCADCQGVIDSIAAAHQGRGRTARAEARAVVLGRGLSAAAKHLR